MFIGVGDDGQFRDVVVPARDGEADAIDRDRAFRHDIARKFFRDLYTVPPVFSFPCEMSHAADGVHMAQNKMAAEFLVGGERLLEIDARALL